MLEYFSYKKYKKHQANKAAHEEEEDSMKIDGGAASTTAENVRHQTLRQDSHMSTSSSPLNPVLDPEDESFIERLLSDEGPAPPLPPRRDGWQEDWVSDSESASSKHVPREDPRLTEAEAPKSEDSKGKGKKKDTSTTTGNKKANRLSFFFSKPKKPEEETPQPNDGLQPEGVPKEEGKKEEKDLSNVLDRLNLSAKNNKVVHLSNESSQLLSKFTQVFKDLVNGVPTAYDDLTSLIEDRDGTIQKGFDKLPSSLQKLVTRLPEKLTTTLAPELLVVAAESQGIKTSAEGGMKGAAKKLFLPQNLSKLVTTPGALVGMLRAIVEALKARWPAFMGMNVIWSVALSLLLFLLWYCHKRGREVRLEGEQAQGPLDGADRVEELPDDPALPATQDPSDEAGQSDGQTASNK